MVSEPNGSFGFY